jgi:hypothetical protein
MCHLHDPSTKSWDYYMKNLHIFIIRMGKIVVQALCLQLSWQLKYLEGSILLRLLSIIQNYWNKNEVTSFKFVGRAIPGHAKQAYHRAWLGWAKQVVPWPPDGLPARPKHDTERASGWPGPV